MNKNIKITSFILILLVVTQGLHASNYQYYDKPNTLVNDYSNILSTNEKNILEKRLRLYNDSTSNQIVVLIIPTLFNKDIMTIGQEIAQEWGIGQKQYNNGVLILIKSKTKSEPDGEVAILPGYGLEGALPDIFCKKIIDDKMISDLSDGDYYNAIVEALDVILPVAKGEYNYAQYQKDELKDALIGIGVSIILILIIVIPLARYNKKHPIATTGPVFGPYIGGSIRTPHIPTGNTNFGGFGGGSFGGGGAHGRF